ncbi:hypothetical protein Tco_1209367, partial [Tanacetum coccineum]
MAERRKKQVLVYFISRTLHGAGLEYLELEKLILALIYAILTRLEKLRCITTWAIELGEHEIEFRGRNSIKGHILADFLAKTPPKKDREIKDRETKRKEPEPENAWKLFIDGASSFDGWSRLMLVNPEGKEYTYAL